MPYHSNSNKKHYRLKPVPIIVAILLLLILGVLIFSVLNKPKQNKETSNPSLPQSSAEVSSEPTSSEAESKVVSKVASKVVSKAESKVASKAESKAESEVVSESNGELPTGSLTDWNLILLNPAPNNKVDGDLDIEMTAFNGEKLDKRVGEFYKKMAADAKAEGINLFLRSGYRFYKTQKLYYDSNVKMNMDAGNSKEEAIRLTELYYAIPGHSEHQSGLAADIISVEYHNQIRTLDERFEKTDAFKWLDEHSAEYGFILRYQKDKKDITKINYEPWHYRFVGVEHAKYIKEHGLCFEEYLELFEN